MPREFSADCQAARQAMQAAWDAWGAASDAVRDARQEVRAKEREAAEAGEALAAARDAEAAANAAWDALIVSVTSGPALGVGGLEAGLGTPPEGGNAAGPFPTRPGGSIVIWARDERPDPLHAWHAEADRRIQENRDLGAAAAGARDARARAEFARDAADEALADASFALHTALMADDQARAAYETARSAVSTACAGQTFSTGGEDGPEIVVDPGVLPEDEERVKDRLDSIPENELEDLDDIEMHDEPGHAFTYTDANTGEEVDTIAAGTYGSDGVNLYDVIGPRAEEVLKHEIGHHVFSRLPDDAVQEWRRWYETGDNKLRAPRGRMPSGYASRDAGEGWAECYEMFRDHPDRLDPEAREKVRELLGRLP